MEVKSPIDTSDTKEKGNRDKKGIAETPSPTGTVFRTPTAPCPKLKPEKFDRTPTPNKGYYYPEEPGFKFKRNCPQADHLRSIFQPKRSKLAGRFDSYYAGAKFEQVPKTDELPAPPKSWLKSKKEK